MTEQSFDKVLATQEAGACIKFFQTMDEKQRKALAPRVLDWLDVCTLVNLDDWEVKFWSTAGANAMTAAVLAGGDKPSKRVEKLIGQIKEAKEKAKSLPPQASRTESLGVIQLALMATSTLTEIKKRRAVPSPEHCFAILKDRRPKWLLEWTEWVSTICPHTHWDIVHKLESEGVVELEINSNYLSAMALALAGTADPFKYGWQKEHLFQEAQETPIPHKLASDPKLMERVWLMFDDDQTMRAMLHTVPPPTGRDQWSPEVQKLNQFKQVLGQRWKAAIINMCRSGQMDRKRALSTLMTVFTRFNLEHSDSGSSLDTAWYTELHDKAEPSNEIRKELLPNYIRLLNCRNSKVVTWASDMIGALVADPDFPVETVCQSVPSVFLMKGKEHSAQALKLLKDIADRHNDCTAMVAYAAANGLDSENQEVQKRTMVLIEKLKFRDDQLVEIIRSKVSNIAVVHRDRATAWLGEDIAGKGDIKSDNKGDTAPSELPSNVVSLKSRNKTSTADGSNKEIAPSMGVDQSWRDDCKSRIAHLQSELRKLAGIEPVMQALESQTMADLGEAGFVGNDVPRLDPSAQLQPVANLDELIFLCSELLQAEWNGVYSPDSIEMVLDGIARVGANRPPDFAARTDAIRAQAMRMLHDPLGSGVVTWLTGSTQILNDALKKFVLGQDGSIVLQRERFQSVATKAHEGQTVLLLSTPTHKGGWIDPVVLVQRVTSVREESRGGLGRSLLNGVLSAFGVSTEQSQNVDQCLAILRMAPEKRAEALKLLCKSAASGEFVEALKYALGAERVNIGSNQQLWIAAARARNPLGDDKIIDQKFPFSGPDGACAARYELRFVKESPHKQGALGWRVDNSFRLLTRTPALPAEKSKGNILPVSRHRLVFDDFTSQKYYGWTQTIFPVNADAYFAEGVERIVSHDGQDSVGKLNSVYLESVYDPDVPVTPVVLIMLAVALTSKQKDEHTIAVEAIIAAIEDGRLGGSRLGSMMRELFNGQGMHPKGSWNPEYVPIVVPSRWAKGLKPVAQASPYHAYAVRLALLELLQGDPAKAPRDVHLMLELLLELLMNDGDTVTTEATLEYLQALGKLVPSGKTAKLVKQLMALKRTAVYDQRREEILRFALERRVERAERWADRMPVPQPVTTS